MRARGIKPGFFVNEELAALPMAARLLFQGLWCLADRAGRLEDRPARIKAQILPYDECSPDELLSMLAPEFIIRYEIDGARYIQVINFTKHQNPHYKEAASRIPAPPGWEDSAAPGGAIPTPTREAVMQRDGFRCRQCGSDDNLTLDHIVPQSKGGSHAEENLQVLCRSCNSAKKNREASAELGPTSVQSCADVGSGKVPHDPLTPDSGLLTPDSIENILSGGKPDPSPGNGPGPSKAALVRGRFEHWRATFPEETRRMSLTKDRQRAIFARLTEGIAPSTIDEAVTNAGGDPWWNGARDGEWKADIKTICGKGSTVENLAARSRQGRSGLERLRAEYGGEA